MKLFLTADSVGGVWTYALELARGLAAHAVEILLATAGGPLNESQRAEVAALPHVRLLETAFKLEWMADPWDEVAECGAVFQQAAAAFRPDIVHLNDYSHAARAWPAPVLVVGHSCVASWHDAVRGVPAGPEWDHYRIAVMAGLRGADLVAAPTRCMLGELERHYGPLSATVVAPNGYSPPATVPKVPREAFIFAAGRWWDEAKNIAALGRVADRLPWPVRVAGLPAPEAMVTQLPANVVNLGRLSPAAMRQQYAKAGLYCLPARYEPFGLTPLEAAAHGCPLVLGDIPSLRENWDGAAAFVPPDDADALAHTLTDLIQHPNRRSELARQAVARAADFTTARMTQRYLELYHRLLGAALPRVLPGPSLAPLAEMNAAR